MTPGFQKAGHCFLKSTCSLRAAKTVQIEFELSILDPNFSEIAFLVEIWPK
jgi:hypothetical protein